MSISTIKKRLAFHVHGYFLFDFVVWLLQSSDSAEYGHVSNVYLQNENCHNVTVCVTCRVIKYSVNNNKITLCSDRVSFIAYFLFRF
jgi:hypothetical protein